MNFSANRLKLFFAIFIALVIVMTVASVFVRLYKEEKYPEKFGIIEQEEMIVTLPKIVSTPVESIAVGEEFLFLIRLSPLDESVSISLLESPEWLTLQDDVVSGVASETGTFKFVLRIQKAEHHYDEVYYLLVREN